MNTKRILVVDDETAITRLLKLNLEKTGRYVVLIENAGANVCAVAQQFKPDLVLLDVMMPDMDGGDVVNALRLDPELQNIPVIFLTAAVKQEEIGTRQGLIGGFHYIAKPLDLEGIIAAINRHLEAHAQAD